MRTYEKTHPWLKFSLDLRELEHATWILVGEAVSKTEHIAGVPLDPEAAKELHAVYIAKGVLATTAIEGNTLTEDEVRRYLDRQLELSPSRQYLGQEIDNIVHVCNRIGDAILNKKSRPISVDEIREYNRLVLQELPLQEDVVPGELRQHSVMVGRYRGVPAEDCEFLLNKFCEWLNSLEFPKKPRAALRYNICYRRSSLFCLDSPFRRRQWANGPVNRVSLSSPGGIPDTCGPSIE